MLARSLLRNTFEDDDSDFPLCLDGLDMPVVLYIRTLKEENVQLKSQLNEILDHEAGIWEMNISLQEKNTTLEQDNIYLKSELESAEESSKSLQEKMYALWEVNNKLDKSVDDFAKENTLLMEEIRCAKEAEKSLEDKIYVMNAIMDDLMTACDCLFENLQTLLQDSAKQNTIAVVPLRSQQPPTPQKSFRRILDTIRTSKMFGFEDNKGLKLKITPSGNINSEIEVAENTKSEMLSPHLTFKPELDFDGDEDGVSLLTKKLKACADISTTLRKQTRFTH